MIVARLAGGLGNQMFQYAFARALAKHNRTSFALDCSFFRKHTVSSQRFTAREYELGRAFGIEREITPDEVDALAMMAAKKAPGAAYRLLREDESRLDMGVFGLGPNLVFEGYFQSERYFANAAEEVREDFTFAPTPGKGAAAVLETIGRAGQPVAVHIRRGDYCAIPDVMPLCSEAYYAGAARLVRSRVADPHFFVFAATATLWAKDLFTALNLPFTLVDDSLADEPDCESLRLMAACRHHIIANSSFSWWGAWLGRGEGQVTVSPSLWTRHTPDAQQNLPDWNLLDIESGEPVSR